MFSPRHVCLWPVCYSIFTLAACSSSLEDVPPWYIADSGIRDAGPAAPLGDVNRVGPHRLNNTEYDNTVRALLGVEKTSSAAFIADEKAYGFDNNADALGMTEAQYEQYFNAADELVDSVFANSELRARILTCVPDASDVETCTREIIGSLGARAWRRPLQNDEVDALNVVASAAIEHGESFEVSIMQVVKAMLSSVPFLYRLELDADHAQPHPLDSYELASRLSYLVWSSMPDDQLLELAASDALQSDDTLRAEVLRMLDSPQSQAFIESFAGQWLALRDLRSHVAEPKFFPEWNAALRAAMVQEGLSYFAEFVHGRADFTEFLVRDVNFVDAKLARLYGIAEVDSKTPVRVEVSSDERRGFLGLAGFLSQTSFAHRTSPTLRKVGAGKPAVHGDLTARQHSELGGRI